MRRGCQTCLLTVQLIVKISKAHISLLSYTNSISFLYTRFFDVYGNRKDDFTLIHSGLLSSLCCRLHHIYIYRDFTRTLVCVRSQVCRVHHIRWLCRKKKWFHVPPCVYVNITPIFFLHNILYITSGDWFQFLSVIIIMNIIISVCPDDVLFCSRARGSGYK